MEYSKLQLSVTRTAEFRSAEPAARGIWVSCLSYCADQENGGTIAACRGWSDRQWMAACGVSAAEVEQAVVAGLLTWEGDSLVVRGYDSTGERECQRQREKQRRIREDKRNSEMNAGGRTGYATGNRTGYEVIDQTSPTRPGHPGQAIEEDSSSTRSLGAEPPERERELFKALKDIGCAVLLKDPAKWGVERAKWLQRTAGRSLAEVVAIIEASSPRIVWASQFPDQRDTPPKQAQKPEGNDTEARPEEVASWATTWRGTLRKYASKPPEWWSGGQYQSLAKDIPEYLRDAVLASCPDPRQVEAARA